ncbi:MAG: NAD(P)-dependent oxidoreductase [bacterium]|nr:NAD(P)-dependent oxidoreductase [bacterium]
MRILLTGGSGDLGTLLSADLLGHAYDVASIDMAAPRIAVPHFVKGSIIDRAAVKRAMAGVDCAVHIAAWHGIHEVEKTKTPEDFHDLNVTGTFNMLEAAAAAKVRNFVFISSTSVSDPYSVYGNSKIVGEEMCRAYASRHGMRIIILRPRAFIPSWNRQVYKTWNDWAAWFMRGAVHIDDVKQSVMKSILHLAENKPVPASPPILTIDGAYEYTADDIANWDRDGAGATFRKHYAAHEANARAAKLDITRKPKILDITQARATIGYAPAYSLKTLLEELAQHGEDGPPAPFPRTT